MVQELESEGGSNMGTAISKLFVVMTVCTAMLGLSTHCRAITIKGVNQGEDVFSYVERVNGSFDQTLYQQVIGASNAFKEGDVTIGVGADDETTRKNARTLLANTKISDLYEHPLLADDLQKLVWQTTDQAHYEKVKDWTMGELKDFLLTKSEAEIKGIMGGLTSETIGCVPKLMSNDELIALDQKIFNVLPGTMIGAKGYLSARIQPNSPTEKTSGTSSQNWRRRLRRSTTTPRNPSGQS
jgi:ethanolamine ammonia-lyase large subunit